MPPSPTVGAEARAHRPGSRGPPGPRRRAGCGRAPPLLVGALADVGPRAQVVDAASLIRTDASHGAAAVEWPDTRTQIRAWCTRWGEEIPIVTGFIGSTVGGATTTLGRGSSDYSAALLARGLGAERLERWTDVDALYTCDPTEHDEARRLS